MRTVSMLPDWVIARVYKLKSMCRPGQKVVYVHKELRIVNKTGWDFLLERIK